jgi:dTDP-4-amino-4,6-dideoxygalactose transaminase
MIPLFKVHMNAEAPALVGQVLLSGYIGEGEKVKEFERALQEELGAPSLPLAVNSCTSAITLALHMCGVGPGKEVITTPITCTATNSPIVTLGGTPVFADVDPITGNIDPESVKKLITKNTAAIIAVDWVGRFCDYKSLQYAGIPVIQDAAHGPFEFDGRPTGDFICLSFQAIKHMTTGDGGALIFNTGSRNAGFRKRARLLRWYGLDREDAADFRCAQNITEVGYKFHMNDINAAIGLANIGSLAENVNAHLVNAAYLHKHINNKFVELAPFDPKAAYWVFPLLVRERKTFEEYLKARGIAASQVHARNDNHDAFPDTYHGGVALFNARQINIPCGWWLGQIDLDYIVKVINDWDGWTNV